jgi:hypothetical protein
MGSEIVVYRQLFHLDGDRAVVKGIRHTSRLIKITFVGEEGEGITAHPAAEPSLKVAAVDPPSERAVLFIRNLRGAFHSLVVDQAIAPTDSSVANTTSTTSPVKSSEPSQLMVRVGKSHASSVASNAMVLPTSQSG